MEIKLNKAVNGIGWSAKVTRSTLATVCCTQQSKKLVYCQRDPKRLQCRLLTHLKAIVSDVVSTVTQLVSISHAQAVYLTYTATLVGSCTHDNTAIYQRSLAMTLILWSCYFRRTLSPGWLALREQAY